jgi:nucleoside-diphosphate-sugar epimerase
MHGKRRLLITGATGFIGQHLVPALVGHGHKVVAAVRRPMTLSPSVDLVLIKDLADGVDWMPFLQGIDVVIHLAALAHQPNDVKQTLFDKINRQATADLARATARAGARLIFVSSIAAQSASSSNRVLTENDPCLPSTAYGRSKLNAEIDIAASGGQYVILRPTLVYGKGVKGNMHKLIRLARLPLPLPFAAATNKRSLLAIENLISAIGLLIQRDEIRNEVFLVADATPVSLPEIIARLRHGMGRPANLISIPPALLSDFFRMWRMSEQWEKLAGNLTVSVAKLNSIGYSPVIATL